MSEQLSPEQRAERIALTDTLSMLEKQRIRAEIASAIRDAGSAERAYERESCANDAEAFGASQVADYLREFGGKRGRQ